MIATSLLVGCTTNRLRGTTHLDSRTFLEYYNFNPFGVDELFLTDSANFSVCIAKYDSDDERIYCKSSGDTIIVIKLKDNGFAKRTPLDSAKFSSDSLVKFKVHSSTPILDFN